MIAVVAGSAGYRTAAAELPLSTRLSEDRAEAIVVVPGDEHWCDGVRAAAEAGAAAIVVSRPVAVPAERIRALGAELGDLPVVVERPLLRGDAVVDVLAGRSVDGIVESPRLLVVDCVASAATFDVAVRDAAGWLRVLTGSAPALRAGRDGIAQFEPADADWPPSVLSAVRASAGMDRICAHALGEVRSEIDATPTRTTVSTTTALGRMIASGRHESSERLTLRRALATLAGGAPTTDLADLAGDAELAEQVTGSAQRS